MVENSHKDRKRRWKKEIRRDRGMIVDVEERYTLFQFDRGQRSRAAERRKPERIVSIEMSQME